MNRRIPMISAVAVALGLSISAEGCEPASEDTASEVPGHEAAPADSPDIVGEVADTSALEAADEGWRPLSVPDPGQPDTYPLVIRNPHDMPVAVFADGGAGEVLLDTVAARDSSRLRLLIAADSVRLRAVGPGGESGLGETISLDTESEAGWEARF